MGKECDSKLTISMVRTVFAAMVERLRASAAEISDDTVKQAKLSCLDTMISESGHPTDLTSLLDAMVRTTAIMKCSIDAAQFSVRGPLLDLVLEGILCSDGEELRKANQIRTG